MFSPSHSLLLTTMLCQALGEWQEHKRSQWAAVKGQKGPLN